MLITPAPEASYLAEGLVMISTCEICEAGIWSSRAPVPPLAVPAGLPSMRMVRLELPRMLTTPLASTATEGTFCSTFTAVPPMLLRSFSTLMTRLPRSSTTVAFWPVTTTSPSLVAEAAVICKPINSWEGSAAVNVKRRRRTW